MTQKTKKTAGPARFCPFDNLEVVPPKELRRETYETSHNSTVVNLMQPMWVGMGGDGWAQHQRGTRPNGRVSIPKSAPWAICTAACAGLGHVRVATRRVDYRGKRGSP